MNDQLLDIVQHTHNLGGIDIVKVTGTDTSTTINAMSENHCIILDAKFNGPIAEFIGVFGMPNLDKLSTILNISEYSKDAKISISRQAKDEGLVPVGIHFENKAGDFKNDYRFMSATIINEKLKAVVMKSVKWGVEVVPTNLSIQRLKFQYSANSDQTTFTTKTDKGDLNLYFGDHSSHAGNFTFASGITGSLSKSWGWPLSAVIEILSLPGDKIFRISDEGVAQITVDSGIAVWNYTLPAHIK